jgi:hypothetical protein
MVLLVRMAIFSFVRLNMFVIIVVSFPMYVKVAHVCAGVCVVSCCSGFR